MTAQNTHSAPKKKGKSEVWFCFLYDLSYIKPAYSEECTTKRAVCKLNLHQFCTWVALWVPALKLRFFEPFCVTSSSGGTRGKKSWNSIMHEDECYVGKPQSTLMYLFDLLSNRLPGHNPKHPWGGQTLSFPLLLFHMWRHSWVKYLFYGLQCLKSPTWGEGLKRVDVIFIYFFCLHFLEK